MHLAQRLRDEPPPRAPDVCARVVGKHGSWLGFAAYGALYAVSAMAFALALAVYVVFEPIAHWVTGTPDYVELSTGWWVAILAASIVTSAPLSALPFLRWVRRRRDDLAIVARDGTVVDAIIQSTTWATSYGVTQLMRLRRPTHCTIYVRPLRGDGATYRAFVRHDDWVRPDYPVKLVTAERSYALVLGPDKIEFVARRR